VQCGFMLISELGRLLKSIPLLLRGLRVPNSRTKQGVVVLVGIVGHS